MVSIVIKNIGKGIARNVKFTISKDIDYQNAISLSSFGIFKEGIQFFPPDHKYKYILMSVADDKDNQEDKIIFKVQYSDILKKNREQWFTLKFKEIAGAGKLTPPETYIGMIAYRLEQIKKLLDKVLKPDE